MTDAVNLRTLPETTRAQEDVAELLIRGLPAVPERTMAALNRAYIANVRNLPRIYKRLRKIALGEDEGSITPLIAFIDLFDVRLGKSARRPARDFAQPALAKHVEPGKLPSQADNLDTGLIQRALEASARAGETADRELGREGEHRARAPIESRPSRVTVVEAPNEEPQENEEQ